MGATKGSHPTNNWEAGQQYLIGIMITAVLHRMANACATANGAFRPAGLLARRIGDNLDGRSPGL